MSMAEPKIIPPPEVRETIDKTIPLVLSGGQSASTRLLLSKPTAFSFLNPSDPFNEWYQWRLVTFNNSQSGGETAMSPKQWIPSQPSEFAFSLLQPAISMKDLEIIKLTAFYAATYDKFVENLSDEHKKSSQFSFLNPSSSLHGFFKSMVNQYTKVTKPTKSMNTRIETKGSDILERAVRRAEYLTYQDEQSKQRAEDDAKERLEYAQIDWQDFVVVQTVDFDASDLDADLRLPIKREDVEFASIVSKGTILAPRLEPSKITESKESKDKSKEQTFKSPFTGEQIPASEFDEHMRIMNLDPKWKQQKELEKERQSNSNLDMDRAADNLKRMFPKARDSPAKKRR